MLTGPALLAAYADAQMLVLLSRGENFGMVAAEAMAAGVPILLGSHVGLADEVTEAGAGRSIAADSPAVSRLWCEMLDADLRMMGARGQALAREHFARDMVGARILDLLAV